MTNSALDLTLSVRSGLGSIGRSSDAEAKYVLVAWVELVGGCRSKCMYDGSTGFFLMADMFFLLTIKTESNI